MKRRLIPMMLLAVATLCLTVQESGSTGISVPENMEIMLTAVSRDESMLHGGIFSSKWTGSGRVTVEPLAYLTSSGEWSGMPCSSGSGKGCRKFEREYLNKRHIYTVVSADGKGGVIRANPTTLDDCFGYTCTGIYSGAVINNSAIASSSAEPFSDSTALRPLRKEESVAVRNALAALVPKRLDSTKELRLFALQLAGKDMFVVQRAFQDTVAGRPSSDITVPRREIIFLIGILEKGRFRVLHTKGKYTDEDERLLGLIHLKGGRDFLVTVVHNPESHSFHIYGLRDGHLALIYSGGGSSC